MTDAFILLYTSIQDRYTLLTHIRFYSFLRFSIRTAANFILPFYYILTRNNKKFCLSQGNKVNNKIIVSLTSFPKRINRLWLVIETLLRQTQKPDMIILWLSKEQFPNTNSLPDNLLRLIRRGLKIELQEDNLLSHKKYYYAFNKYPDYCVITVDDDIFYSKYLIESLWTKHLEYNEYVICNYGYEISKNDSGVLAPYSLWKRVYHSSAPTNSIFFGSGGGTLFPPYSLHKDLLRKDIFIKYCQYADDVWLNTMARLNKTKICLTDQQLTILPLQYKLNVSLSSVNIYEGLNDVQINKIRDYYLSSIGIDPFGW